jgi:cyclic beta-1,2-glucan synthetase
MKVSSISVFDILSKLRDYFQGEFEIRKEDHGAPFRSELYSSDQMDMHGVVLARSHKLLHKKSSDTLLKRLGDNEKTLLEVRNLLVESIREGKVITPAAEWLLDNFYLIEEQVVIARKHFPKGYSQGLPHLGAGSSEGLPRVYDIVLELISHSDGRVDINSLSSFIAAYQSVKILTLGELWALPIMLRLAVIENLRRIAGQIALDMIDYNLADYWSEKFVKTVKEEPADLILIIADMARSKPVLSGPFVAGLTRNLQGKGLELMLPLNWMEQQLNSKGANSLDLVRMENQRQAADQVSVRNSIGTLRFLGATDWHEFVETLSSVETVLKKDEAGIYAAMDFATRDCYRHVIERIAKSSLLTETEVAQKILELTKGHDEGFKSKERQKHIGYFLIDKGLSTAERVCGVKLTFFQKLKRSLQNHLVTLYLLGVILMTCGIGAIMVSSVYLHLSNKIWLLVLIGLLVFLGTAQLSLSLINWLATILVSPKLLPKMNFSKGIPPEYRSLVVVPTMLSNPEFIESQAEALEIRFLANKDENLHFGLLTDFLDSDTEHLPEDEELLNLVSQKIESLNQKYPGVEQDIFFLFHRNRTWNAKEKKWMGYERKRGKLAALNALILGRGEDQFSKVIGLTSVLSNVKYVITLDADTQLPRDSAWKMIATMAHPLNHPIIDKHLNKIQEGYTILQPRVASRITPGGITPYLRLQGMATGIDPYTRMSSDVYQDLFGEGSFIGKGVYDVRAFDQILEGTLPENRILSHDLLEGSYTRSGLLSDILVYEENPSEYWVDMRRQQRWIRGDWQIAAWVLPYIKNPAGKWIRNRLNLLSKWKIFDNLRRSLLPLTILLLLLIGWMLTPFPLFWTIMVINIALFASIAAAVWQLMNKPPDLTLRAHLLEVAAVLRDIFIRFVFNISVLPFEALLHTQAVLLTNWRIFISRKKLLEWTPSGNVSFKNFTLLSIYQWMWIVPFLAVVCTVFLVFTGSNALLVAAPILLLWFLSPVIVWRFSTVNVQDESGLSEEHKIFLHKSARKTWAYFEQFVTDTDHWLPPDNYQEKPVSAIAHRTSPTNMGLALLANLSAYDFGYISGGSMLSRCGRTLHSMQQLDRYKGHFFNWYDTLSMRTLHPRYISTVDSGNLAGHLLTLKQGLLGLQNQPLISMRNFEGLLSTVRIMKDISGDQFCSQIEEMELDIEKYIESNSITVSSAWKMIHDLQSKVDDLTSAQSIDDTELYRWTRELMEQVSDIESEFRMMIPWVHNIPQQEAPESIGEWDTIPNLRSLSNFIYDSKTMSDQEIEQKTRVTGTEENELLRYRKTVKHRVHEREALIAELSNLCEEFSNLEYDFLYDKATNLLRIGYNVDENRRDDGFYDLLASEARLGIFVAIAQRKLPQDSWFALGRLLTNAGGDPTLLSWSGSMFEYLMPQLVMPSYDHTLLAHTNKASVNRQIQYGAQRSIPWGISESAYNRVDAGRIYQYRAFGVPGLGLKRGLEDDLVIAPYATMLALMISPEKAANNLQEMSARGFEGQYGFYEAVDYTPARLQRGMPFSIVNSYMVHHQGMSLLSLAYVLLDQPMQQRFISELRFQATLLLLQEKVPRATVFYAHTADIVETHANNIDSQIRVIRTANTNIPEIQLLSNGRYQVMVTNSGAGYSKWKDIVITRWREDATQDSRGIFCYIKDIISGDFWSNTHHPTLQKAIEYEAIFSQGHIEFRRLDFGIETKTDIVISPEDDTEMRRIKLSNRSNTTRVLEITSYAEIVLAPQASDESHPAFSNLFIQTEILPEYKAVLCTRRPRSSDEKPPWMFHHMDAYNAEIEEVSYETDRMQFTGRGRTLVAPKALNEDLLGGSQGAVLDPIIAVRYRLRIKPGQSAVVDMIYGISETRESCEALMHKYRDRFLKKRAFELFWTHSQMILRQINASEADGQLYDRLAASIIYNNPAFRADSTVISSNFRGQSNLWSHSVSGDLPIIMLHVFNQENLELVKQLVQAHAYWRLKGMEVDLVILNEDHGSYRQVLQDQILGLTVGEAGNHPSHGKPGKIFVKSADQISPEDRTLFESVARVVIYDIKGSLSDQLNRHATEGIQVPLLEIKPHAKSGMRYPINLPSDLLFNNGIGGFAKDGAEYKMLLSKNKTTPAPWVNVIANPNFGSVVSESGSAYTWAVNAHSYRITPWSNDPVSDMGGEAFYLRNEISGQFWSLSPFPAASDEPYLTTHGFGYSGFEHNKDGISTEMTVFVDKDLPVKFVVIKIKNLSGQECKLSCTGYLDIVLGDLRSKTGMHILSEYDVNTGALFFKNRYNSSFAERVSYFKVNSKHITYTTDRAEFIGRNRNLNYPEAMKRTKLSGRTGAGMDTCAAIQAQFDLLDGGEKVLIFQLGNEVNQSAVVDLINNFNTTEYVLRSLDEVKNYWKNTLQRIQVSTPDIALNLLANGWLAYQNMCCRIFARSGFYQSGGAFGFRDQLQDILSVLISRPEIAKQQILLSASRQFIEGDVQHWWHPPEGRGVRTRCSDDLLWLPYAVTRYISVTGDRQILLEEVNFLESRELHPGEESLYDLPAISPHHGTIFEHCIRAIKRSLEFGEHGLPLIGSGDWNDGMDRVGLHGKGESVWLGFFLYDILMGFAPIAKDFGDINFANLCLDEAKTLQKNLETEAWDGEWFKRAWMDDGSELGSSESPECRIDAIAQSWSVLSDAAGAERQLQAMESLDKHLVRRDIRLIQLLDPPFDDNGPNPGYIRGYVPGVRENGGQYSHAAIWALIAFAKLGQRDKVYELFSLIQPVSHGSDPERLKVYKVEPYVMAADVYANGSHKGRGGWTWYTGSSGWMYQFIVHALLGINQEIDKLVFKPCFPLDWPKITATYKFRSSTYHLTIFQFDSENPSWWKIDQQKGLGNSIQMNDDGLEHIVELHYNINEK